jgi:hypothetical protein
VKRPPRRPRPRVPEISHQRESASATVCAAAHAARRSSGRERSFGRGCAVPGAAAAWRGKRGTTWSSASRAAQLVSPGSRVRRKRRTMPVAQRSKSASAVTCTAFSTVTIVAFGNSAVARAASASGVITSRSPFSTSTGTAGYAAPTGAGGSGTAGAGHSRQP